MARRPKKETTVYLANVPDEFVFYCCDGTIFRNMRELRDGLASMSEETYVYHVNAGKNDFYRWTLDIIRDEKLANDLQKASSRNDAARKVGTRVSTLNRK